MFLPSFSRLDVAEECIFPWQSNEIRWPKRSTTGFANFGTAVGSAAECLAVFGDAPLELIADANSLSDADRKRFPSVMADVRALLIEEEPQTEWRRCERPLAFNVATGDGRELKSTGPRDYSDVQPNEMMGTPDMVAGLTGGRLIVRDYKTGKYKRGHDPTETRQLRALAVAAASAYGGLNGQNYREVIVELVQVDDDEVRVGRGTLNRLDLLSAAAELRELRARIAGRREPPKQGHWCTSAYCPVRVSCPATTATMAAVAAASEMKFPLTTEINGSEHARYLLERLNVIKKTMDDIETALKDFARTEPIDLGDGRRWGPMIMNGRDRFDLTVAGAAELIERELGKAVIERSTSKKAIEAAAKALQEKRGEGIGRARALYDELRKMGALLRGADWEKFDSYKVKTHGDEPAGDAPANDNKENDNG